MKDPNPPSVLQRLRRWSQRKLLAADADTSTPTSTASTECDDPASQVEAELRRLAWRALFREPAIAARDGLDDYDGDYTLFEPRGDMVTYDMVQALSRLQQQETVADSTIPSRAHPQEPGDTTGETGA